MLGLIIYTLNKLVFLQPMQKKQLRNNLMLNKLWNDPGKNQ